MNKSSLIALGTGTSLFPGRLLRPSSGPVLLTGLALVCLAYSSTAGYRVIGRSGHSQVWQQVTGATNIFGRLTLRTNTYTEVATGLNHRDPNTGEWVPSIPKFEALPDGSGVVATNLQTKAFAPADIYTGAIELVTPDGKHLRTRPLRQLGRAGAAGRLNATRAGSIKFLNDNRAFATVQKEISTGMGGQTHLSIDFELHHWFRSQSAGGASAGWNLIAIPSSWNSYMNGAASTQWAANLFKYGIPASLAGAALGGGWLEAANEDCECR